MKSVTLSHWKIRQMIHEADNVRLMMVIYDMFHKAEMYRLYAKNVKAKGKCIKVKGTTLAEKAGVTPAKVGSVLPFILWKMGLRLAERRGSNKGVTYVICLDKGDKA
jgi:hypothetical protein